MSSRLSHEVLYTILDEKDAARVCRALKGFTVTFSGPKITHEEIREDYRYMRERGVTMWQAVERLAAMYDYTPRHVWRIVRDVDV